MLIGASMQLSYGSDMRSVACSGSVTSDILMHMKTGSLTNNNYLGSGTSTPYGWAPRLFHIPQSASLQADAKQDFIPGRVQQIEFVQSTKPAVMTIMIGGNDLKFSKILSDCIMQAIGPFSSHACENINGDEKAHRAEQIRNMYARLKDFYTDLQSASPTTKIFAIGYPKFYDDTETSCVPHIALGSVSRADGHTINELVSYTNATIKNAALDANQVHRYHNCPRTICIVRRAFA